MPDELLTREELAEKLKVEPITIKRWEEEGLPAYKKGSKFVRYDLEKVLAWIEKRQKENEQQEKQN